MNRAEKCHERLKGAVVPLNLCFNDNGTVNDDAVCNYVDWLASEKTPVILLTYGSSEFAWLTDDDLWRLTEKIAKTIDGRSLCVSSTGFWTPRRCREFLQHADAVGVDAVKVQINIFDGPNGDVITAYFDEIEGASDIPLLMWWNPGGFHRTMPPDIRAAFAGIGKRPNVVGIKNDGCPFSDLYALSRDLTGHNCAAVSGGLMSNFLFGQVHGAPAYLCPIAPFRPDIAIELGNQVEAGNTEAALDIIYLYEEPMMAFAQTVNWLVLLKSAVMILGLYPDNRVGSPLKLRATGEEFERIRKFYEELFDLKPVV
ncbi:MAG: dihydrodipicolinate synthase family protein [Lentisphaeria bacterium]|jgi:4-hydroxy-tetrahydrodipicolinate synthase|nr:dihydrodipicolinate synthase family protein [Lentisphaeria bacterium]